MQSRLIDGWNDPSTRILQSGGSCNATGDKVHPRQGAMDGQGPLTVRSGGADVGPRPSCSQAGAGRPESGSTVGAR